MKKNNTNLAFIIIRIFTLNLILTTARFESYYKQIRINISEIDIS